MKYFCVFSLVLLFLLNASSLQAEGIVNGGFEYDYYGDPIDSNSEPGWLGWTVDFMSTGYPDEYCEVSSSNSPYGSLSVLMRAEAWTDTGRITSDARLYQSFTINSVKLLDDYLTDGVVPYLKFDFYPGWKFSAHLGGPEGQINIFYPYSPTYSSPMPDPPDWPSQQGPTGWQTASLPLLEILGDSTDDIYSIEFYVTAASDPDDPESVDSSYVEIDNVRIVPEPAAITLLLCMLVSLGFLRQRDATAMCQ